MWLQFLETAVPRSLYAAGRRSHESWFEHACSPSATPRALPGANARDDRPLLPRPRRTFLSTRPSTYSRCDSVWPSRITALAA
jgi:hypothetical protein